MLLTSTIAVAPAAASPPTRNNGEDFGVDDGGAQMAPDGKTLYFSGSRSLPLHSMRARAQMMADCACLKACDKGDANGWSLTHQPSRSRPRSSRKADFTTTSTVRPSLDKSA